MSLPTLQRHGETVRAIRSAVQQRPGHYVAIMLDTKGPEIRTGLLVDHKPISLKEGQVRKLVLIGMPLK